MSFDIGQHISHMKEARSTERAEKDKRHDDEFKPLVKRLENSKAKNSEPCKRGKQMQGQGHV
jgi:hypothetical protein